MEFGPDLGDRLVEALHAAHGEHPGHRAAHAKGSCATGTFTATAAAPGLTEAPHMQGEPVLVTVRLSNGSGIPSLPDYARSDGRGLAVKFHLHDGRQADMVALTLPVFFVRTPEDFIGFLEATRADPETRQPDLAKVGAFLAEHPETQAALEVALSNPLPAGYGRVAYNGIHAFRLIAAGGAGRWVRYRWEPHDGVATVTPEEARARGRDYLQQELRARLARGPLKFDLVFILASEGDPLTDPTALWPEDRDRVIAGTLELQEIADGRCDRMVFDPTNVVEGIECADDPILHARSAAYARSFALRRGIRPPSVAGRGAEAGAGARAIAAAGTLAPGTMRAVEVDGVRIAVASVEGEMHAVSDVCTHRGCAISDGELAGKVATCPCHGSQFDVTTGEVLRGPAREPLDVYAP